MHIFLPCCNKATFVKNACDAGPDHALDLNQDTHVLPTCSERLLCALIGGPR